MKKILLLSFVSLLFIASTCKKEGEDCHREVTIINKSNQDIIQSFNFKNSSDKCNLSGSISFLVIQPTISQSMPNGGNMF